MSNHLYRQRDLSLSGVSSSRSAIDDHLHNSSLLLSSSRYTNLPSSFSDHLPSSSYFSSLRRRHSSADDFGLPSASTGLWPTTYDAGASRSFATSSFDLGSSISKRSSEAIYGQSILGAHMVGQSEAWLTSDSLTKRPRLEIASHLPIFPQRPGEKDCVHYMLTRTCKFGDGCKFDHPIWVPEGGIPDWKEPPAVPYDSHPERPGEPDCPYFLKTQKCKFGLNCKFHHPKDIVDTSSNASDLPDRPAEPPCSFYMKTGKCKFGVSCKFHHPRDIQIPSTGQEAVEVEQTSSVANTGTSTVADVNSLKVPTLSPASSFNFKGLPMRPGETDCPFYMKTGSCKYGANCRYNHPERNVINPPVAAIGHIAVTSPAVNPFASVFQDFNPRPAQALFGPSPPMYPQRPGEAECEYYSKTGECKFGERCKFHHELDRFGSTKKQTPQEQNIKLTLAGLPRREGSVHCPFYMKTGTCGYGATCRFDHPTPGEVKASLAADKETSASGEKGEEKKAIADKEKASS